MPVPGLTETPTHDVCDTVALADDAGEGLGLSSEPAESLGDADELGEVDGLGEIDGLGEFDGLGEIDGLGARLGRVRAGEDDEQYFPRQLFTSGLSPPLPPLAAIAGTIVIAISMLMLATTLRTLRRARSYGSPKRNSSHDSAMP